MNVTFLRLARFGTVLALAVVMLGAWVRLHDAGLGCPDWPGCYGRLVVPDHATAAEELGSEQYAARPLEQGKAWREMIHRYLAGSLGLVCVALAVIAWRNRKDPQQPWRRPLALLVLIAFQALLGMWTVTLLLKPHHRRRASASAVSRRSRCCRRSRAGARRVAGRRARPARRSAWRALAALVLQIFLGGWTSSNYAALACPDFPTCQTQWWPAIADFEEGFVLWRGIGIDYEGGVLDHPARVAVHFTHRLGAILAAVLIALLGARLAREPATRPDGAGRARPRSCSSLTLGVSIVCIRCSLARGGRAQRRRRATPARRAQC